jgi:hypothetical protein
MGWVWELWGLGTPAQVMQEALALNLHTLAVKVADGTTYWSGTQPAIQTIQAGGYPVFGWQYVYGQDPHAEALTAIQAIHNANLDGFIIDIEAPYETLSAPGAAALLYIKAIRDAYPDLPIGVTSFGDWDFHRSIPLTVLAPHVDVLMPQIYWQDMGWSLPTAWDTCMASYQPFQKPILPIGQAYGPVTPAEIQQFTQNVLNKGIPGLSWYRVGDIYPVIAKEIGRMWWARSPWANVSMTQVTDYINTALALSLPVQPTWTPELTTAVRTFQTDQHLVVDGIVGNETWHALYTSKAPVSPAVPADPFAQYEKEIADLQSQLHNTQTELTVKNNILADIQKLM